MSLLLGAELFRGILQQLAQLFHDKLGEGVWTLEASDAVLHTHVGRQLLTANPIPVLQCPSLLEFYECMVSATPVIIRGAIDDWPCMTKWKHLSYLRCVVFESTDFMFQESHRAVLVTEA